MFCSISPGSSESVCNKSVFAWRKVYRHLQQAHRLPKGLGHGLSALLLRMPTAIFRTKVWRCVDKKCPQEILIKVDDQKEREKKKQWNKIKNCCDGIRHQQERHDDDNDDNDDDDNYDLEMILMTIWWWWHKLEDGYICWLVVDNDDDEVGKTFSLQFNMCTEALY